MIDFQKIDVCELFPLQTKHHGHSIRIDFFSHKHISSNRGFNTMAFLLLQGMSLKMKLEDCWKFFIKTLLVWNFFCPFEMNNGVFTNRSS